MTSEVATPWLDRGVAAAFVPVPLHRRAVIRVQRGDPNNLVRTANAELFLVPLERFLLPCAFEARWSAGNEWRARLLRQNSAAAVKQSLRAPGAAPEYARRAGGKPRW